MGAFFDWGQGKVIIRNAPLRLFDSSTHGEAVLYAKGVKCLRHVVGERDVVDGSSLEIIPYDDPSQLSHANVSLYHFHVSPIQLDAFKSHFPEARLEHKQIRVIQSRDSGEAVDVDVPFVVLPYSAAENMRKIEMIKRAAECANVIIEQKGLE